MEDMEEGKGRGRQAAEFVIHCHDRLSRLFRKVRTSTSRNETIRSGLAVRNNGLDLGLGGLAATSVFSFPPVSSFRNAKRLNQVLKFGP